MANNFGSVVERLAPQVETALMELPALFRWVNSDFSLTPGSRGDTIPSQFTVPIVPRAVTPGVIFVAPADLAPRKVDLVINNWEEAAFVVRNDDALRVTDEFLAQQAREAVRALGNFIEVTIYNEMVSTASGTISAAFSTTPMVNINSGTCLLDRALAPSDDRTFLFNTYVKNQLLNFNSTTAGTFMLRGSNTNPEDAVVNGNLGRIAGDCRAQATNLPQVLSSFLFHRGAVGVAVRTARGANDIVVQDPRTGLPFVLQQRDLYYEQYISVSCLWGVKALRGEFAVQYTSVV